MKTKLSMLAFLAVTTSYAGGDIVPVESVPVPVVVEEDVLKASAQVRFGYIGYSYDDTGTPTDYASALGGQVKIETVDWNGFSLGATFYTSHMIKDMSGDIIDNERNYELTGGGDGTDYYDLLSEAYIAYKYDTFGIKVGRQLIDTPYADSDDIRMTPNTFQGVVASYGLDKFTILGAYLTQWQGPDADTYEFTDMLSDFDGDSVAMVAATYASDIIEAGIWWYGADKTTDIIYGDVTVTYAASENVELKAGFQASSQSARDDSHVEATLFGAMAEVGFSSLTLAAAYNTVAVDDGNVYFGGFGGGVGFVNMDEMTAGALAENQDVDSMKFAIGYDFSEIGVNGLSVEYAYGNFKGDIAGEFTEQDIVFAYAQDETWDVEVIYAMIDDEEASTIQDEGLDRLLVRANYNF